MFYHFKDNQIADQQNNNEVEEHGEGVESDNDTEGTTDEFGQQQTQVLGKLYVSYIHELFIIIIN